MEEMKHDESEHDQPAHHHVARRVTGLDVIPLLIAVRTSPPVLQCEADGEINVKENCNQQRDSHQPKERPEVSQMLRIIIDPTRSEKNLQISKEMPDDKEHQNDAGKGDDHFFTDGRAIKRGEGSHEANTLVFFNSAFN